MSVEWIIRQLKECGYSEESAWAVYHRYIDHGDMEGLERYVELCRLLCS